MYTILNQELLPVGSLNLHGNSKGTKFWGDTITQQIADDGSNDDPSANLAMTANKLDKQANHKLWNHSITLSFDNDLNGSQVVAGYYLTYYDDVMNHYYLIYLNNVQQDPEHQYRLANGINSAIYDMAGIYPEAHTFTQATLMDIIKYVFGYVPWSAQVVPNDTKQDYTIDGATTAQAIVQDLQVKFNVEVDAYVTLNASGRIDERVVWFGKLGTNKGSLIRSGSAAKGYESMTATSVSDMFYTKFYIKGITDENDKNAGSIASVNNGLTYIIDDNANRKFNPVGASAGTYREIKLENTVLKNPTALLDWAKDQVSLFNHPRYNYTVVALHDMVAGLGDTVAIQDKKAIPEILITSRVIQRAFSFSSPETNQLTFGEFSSLNALNNKAADAISVIKKSITIVQEAADNAVNQAKIAHDKALSAQEQAIHAQTSADGKATIFSVNSDDDLPVKANEGDIAWVALADGTHGYTYLKGKWGEDINPTMAKNITDGVTNAISQAQAHTDEVKQALSNDIETAKSQATSQVSAALTSANSAATSQFSQAQNALAEAKTNLQNDIDESKGNIVEINKTLTGFDGTLQRVQDAVNGLGQTNQLMNTEFTPDTEGWTLYADKGSNAPYASFASYGSRGIGFNTVNADANTYARLSQTILLPNTRLSTDVMSLTWRVNTRRMDNYCHIWLMWQDANGVSLGQSTMGNWNDSTLNNYNVLKWENISIPIDAKQVDIRFETREGTNAYLFQPMVSFTNTIGTYVQGNYNNNEALAKVKLTADQALLDLSTYQIDADGRIKKAQSGIEANATAITKKVSQTDYDKKTGELSNKLNTTTDTADGTKQALSDYKEYANGNISGIASDLSKLAGEVSLKLSKTDYDDSQSILNTSLSQWKADYDGWTGTVSRLSDKVNNLGQVNQLFNTEFSPDLSGWDSYPTISTNIDSTQSHNGSNVIVIKHDSSTTWGAFRQSIANFVKGDSISASVFVGNIAGAFQINIESYDSSKNRTVIKSSQLTSTGFIKFENLKIPADATQLYFSFWSGTANSTLTISQPMLVFASTVGTYTQGNYNNNAALAQVKITADGISKFVRDPSGNISYDFQTALSKTSIITGSTLSTSIQKQTATQITSALTDNNGKIISLINQDSSGVQIAGKNIVLDGTVTVTNAFTVSQANIANGAIGTAQIGDTAITSAKIANLDVSKLTGDTITGFNFNVNRSLTVAQGGTISSDVVNMSKDSFMVKTANGNSDSFLTAFNVNTSFSGVKFSINSANSEMKSTGTIYADAGGAKTNATFATSYAPNHLFFGATGWSDNSQSSYIHVTERSLTMLSGAATVDKATSYSTISSNSIQTQGFMSADGGWKAGKLYTLGGGAIYSASGETVYFLNGKAGGRNDIAVKSVNQSSLVSLKENISKVTPKQLLSETLRADIRSYNFTGDDITDKHVTPMIDDVNHEMYIPSDWLSLEGTGVDTYSIIGYLIGSVKALQEQITELKANR